MLEETYEVIDAIDSGKTEKIEEELGDLLMLVTMMAQVATDVGAFTIHTVIDGISKKMIRRHPHIFGDTTVGNVDEVLTNWQKIKEQERKANGDQEKGVLDGLPRSLPALAQGLELQSRAAKVGFDWPTIDGVLSKIAEEIQEMQSAVDNDELEAELGDLLFVLVNFARWNKIDPENALNRTNQKFRARFKYIETKLRNQNLSVTDVDLEVMDALWNEAKATINLPHQDP